MIRLTKLGWILAGGFQWKSTSAVVDTLPGSTGSLVLRSDHRLRTKRKRRLHFGDSRCPCIGFDNINGETTVFLDDFGEVAYPADLGARCEQWDNGMHPGCKEGKSPGFGNDWCAQPWCYVDACNCDIPILPKLSAYVPDARYRGKPVYYSYATCGATDTWAKVTPEVGSPGCRCIGFDDIPGKIDVVVTVNSRTQVVAYPAEVGGTCRAWDDNRHPMCQHGDDSVPWCRRTWCYVDPCSCTMPDPPKTSMYLPEATFAGKALYYSYETCGSEDIFTEVYNTDACLNQFTKGACLDQKRFDGEAKCAWTGRRCLGAELVDHPSCTKGANSTMRSLTVRSDVIGCLVNLAASLLVISLRT